MPLSSFGLRLSLAFWILDQYPSKELKTNFKVIRLHKVGDNEPIIRNNFTHKNELTKAKSSIAIVQSNLQK